MGKEREKEKGGIERLDALSFHIRGGEGAFYGREVTTLYVCHKKYKNINTIDNDNSNIDNKSSNNNIYNTHYTPYDVFRRQLA